MFMHRCLGVLIAAFAVPSDATAEPITKATIVQMHPVIGPGEDVFIYAVPKQLGYFKAEGLDVSIQGAQSGTVAAQVIQSGVAQIGTTPPASALQMPEQGADIFACFDIKQD